ncbi:hypothetical protein RHGRI_012125 [Rhododendron griersonianum]|uniref:GRF-type domain-containing protein n=1 Tax=Rhododendron griersonianum TaxID=479676 RepID=A0AAV6KQE7_9ERIC|nr:hypothetical protein RHGRI_012125 [Rhododendron griersonianum]
MDSSSSSTNLCTEDSKKFCRCGLRAPLKTSKTTTNPGMKFYGCTKYKTKQSCGFFIWLDELLTIQEADRSQRIQDALGLHRDEERQT